MAARARRRNHRTIQTGTLRTGGILRRLLSLPLPCGLMLTVSVCVILGWGHKTAVSSHPDSAAGLPGSQGTLVNAARFEADRQLADECFMLREQADFLLTPALLIQEAMCDDVVLTYPEE